MKIVVLLMNMNRLNRPILIILVFTTAFLQSLYGQEKQLKLNKLRSADFTAHYPVYSVVSNQTVKPSSAEKRAATPLGTKELVVLRLTDQKTPYENSKAAIIILENSQAKWRLEVRGFKNLSADWVTEEVLKVEVWPGRAVQLVELINIETGDILYRSATGHIFAPLPGDR
ncbi:MAG: hypothetical protein L0Z53_04325 [Acidobacteriales bacterium]|nr:hypothetical protein [Terriglobales bacterium]